MDDGKAGSIAKGVDRPGVPWTSVHLAGPFEPTALPPMARKRIIYLSFGNPAQRGRLVSTPRASASAVTEWDGIRMEAPQTKLLVPARIMTAIFQAESD